MSAFEPPERRGERCLIVNADDFGISEGVNRGIIEAHERGIVTSASFMVRYPGAADAAAYARQHPELSVGLHFDIAEWRYEAGEWRAAYAVVDANDSAAVEAELRRQLALFERLMSRGPTHLDSHQHVHLEEPARTVARKCARELHVPLRGCDSLVTYCGSFYGQSSEGEAFPDGISADGLIKLISDLPAGWTEAGCHPGYGEDLDSVYCAERADEVRVLCSERVREALVREGVQLRSFHDVANTCGRVSACTRTS
jgi:predicted glycoside hydrolase/deacetylase ChbG (UPF0249 family)